MIAVEAKGHTEVGTAGVERGIVQGYDRLHEANAGYVAALRTAVSQLARTLARELNVGVLGITFRRLLNLLETTAPLLLLRGEIGFGR